MSYEADLLAKQNILILYLLQKCQLCGSAFLLLCPVAKLCSYNVTLHAVTF